MPRPSHHLFTLLLAAACLPSASEPGEPGSSGPAWETATTAESPGSGTASSEPSLPTTGDTPVTSDVSTTGDLTMGSTGTSSSGDAPVCGDAVVEGTEECDAGFDANKDHLLCTSSCHHAVCGDDHVQAILGEQCDDGALNVAEPGYNQCSTTCRWGARCGDGVVQPEDGEECEPDPGIDEFDNCAMTCRYKPRTIFLTSMTRTGDLNGIAGADALCNQAAASSPDLKGTFRAWLLVNGQSLTDRFPEFSQANLPWNFTNAGNDLLAQSFQQLVEDGPAHSLVYTEHGEVLTEKRVWTNITSSGKSAGADCSQWTSTDGQGLYGHSGHFPDQGPDAEQWHAEGWWTGIAWDFCYLTFHLYCVQVAD